ncbi:carbohydrate porin [Bradyrhizobium japonicum]|uniref:carbohydrate porin n=1 Tax=Bradyrhizobium japonicum TaxID=375 RepID=UPI00289876C7|nr:carbohydrate porin [Bradyrhizobium japonicum]
MGLRDDRPDDKFGIAAGYAHVSRRAQTLDADHRRLVNPNWPIRSFEGLLTAVYLYQIKDEWTVQPNYQYIVHPGGNIAGRPARRKGPSRTLRCSASGPRSSSRTIS